VYFAIYPGYGEGGSCGSAGWLLLVAGPDAKAVNDSMENAQDSVLRYFVSVIPLQDRVSLVILRRSRGCWGV
jgi:hypothetical protein